MNRHKGWGLLVVAGLGVALGKSYHLASVEQDVYLLSSGLVRVVDTRTFVFEGVYREVFFTLEPRSGGQVRFEGASALDGKPAVYQVEGNRLSITAGPSQKGNLPPLASDEKRTFRFSYTLSNELEVAQDAALFDRQVLEPIHAAIDRYVLRLHAPQPAPELFRVFIFTGQGRIGSLEFDPARQRATVKLAPVGENEFVRSRVLLDPRGFTVRTLNAPRLEAWLKETEAQTQRFRERSRRAQEPIPTWVAWLGAVPIGFFLLLLTNLARAYWQGGREPTVQEVGRYYREPAEEIPPGLVPYVLHQHDPGQGRLGLAFSATLLNLARQGNLELVRHHEPGLFGLFGREEVRFRLHNPPQGSGFEGRVYAVLQKADGGDGTVSPQEIRSYFQRNPGQASALAALPRAEYEQAHGPLLDPSSSRQGALWTGILGVAGMLSLMAAILTVPLGQGFFAELGYSEASNPTALVILALALAATGLGLLGLSRVAYRSLPRWQPDKLLNAQRWAAYRNFLADFSQMETAPPEHFRLWDYHFVYASALGVAERYLRNLRGLAERQGRALVAPPWVGDTSGGGSSLLASAGQIAQVTQSLEAVTRNLNHLESALRPHSSGSGGGFGGSSSGGSSGGGSSSGAR
ncbi:DUF2207 family protein [Meiothermus granaticius]|uniref:DUF2207 domain-containing protein n=1 Tax=Meiothermus granaticius NBRC 107808 TaxID=1227551 RepID=A0A399FCF4_9DEIN|nr:DUF2207 domain-containing protein [Meiothermus granaticius]RIH93928.1 hypothetical protein Mgrana_00014 [Meiothermus granaticius NBRC 107808]GEM87826.1 hypothetical protein MGR01S_24510 [Meiothermus granaticius NBRC 107808]